MTQNNNHLRSITFNETFESSLAEKSTQKFTVDKSLIKGIKQNDVSKIIDQNQVSGGNENKQLLEQYSQIEAVVIDIRKRYDETKTQLHRHEQQIQKLKKHKEILAGQESKLSETILKQRKNLQKTSEMFSQISALLESTNYRKDIYTGIKDNVKHDLLVLKKRYFDKDVKLMRQGTKLRTLKTDHDSKIKLSKRCKEMLSSVQKSAYTSQMERTTKIQSFCDVLNRKQVNRQNRQVRDQQIMQTMISAMTDKLAEEKQWIKMFDANLFLKGLLKAKMERLMDKYHRIELCFHKMKQTTSMKNSNEFIQRFLNREQTYGLLLQSISEKEKLLQELKEERDQLEKIHQNCLYLNEEISQEQKKVQPNFSEDLTHKELHQLNQKVLENARQNQLIYQWATRFLSAFQGNSTRDKTIEKFPKTKKKELTIEVLGKLKAFLTQLQSEESQAKKIEESFHRATPKNHLLTSEIYQRNKRIKTMSTFENYDRGLDSFEDKDMTHDDISQADYLQHNRRAIKKSDIYNRKFRIKSKLA